MSEFQVTATEHGPDDLEVEVRLQATFRVRGTERQTLRALGAIPEYVQTRLLRANLDGMAPLVLQEGGMCEAEYRAGLLIGDLAVEKFKTELTNMGMEEE